MQLKSYINKTATANWNNRARRELAIRPTKLGSIKINYSNASILPLNFDNKLWMVAPVEPAVAYLTWSPNKDVAIETFSRLLEWEKSVFLRQDISILRGTLKFSNLVKVLNQTYYDKFDMILPDNAPVMVHNRLIKEKKNALAVYFCYSGTHGKFKSFREVIDRLALFNIIIWKFSNFCIYTNYSLYKYE